jgi:DNA repair exonuclease SbcCD ATPase subunit
MIDSIEISYYESHKSTVMYLHSGVNVITGETGSGKSRIVNAIGWGLQNRPIGLGFRSHFAGKKDITSVGLCFDDGSLIREKKGTTLNQYQIEDPETGEFIALKALGSDVPDEVTAITKMGAVNIHRQHDRYFLLEDTPGQVAKKFNEVVGLDIIDIAQTRSIALVNKITTEHERLIIRQQETETSISEYAFLDEAKVLLSEINIILKDLEEIKQVRTELSLHIKNQEELEVKIANLTSWLKVEEPVIESKNLCNEVLQLQTRKRELHSAILDVTLREDRIKGLKAWLQVEDDLKEALKTKEAILELTRKCNTLQVTISNIETSEIKVAGNRKILEEKKTNFIGKVFAHKICPFCKQELTEDHILEIKKWIS